MRCSSASGSAGFGGIAHGSPYALTAAADLPREARRRLPVAGVLRRDFAERGPDDALVNGMASVARIRIEQLLIGSSPPAASVSGEGAGAGLSRL